MEKPDFITEKEFVSKDFTKHYLVLDLNSVQSKDEIFIRYKALTDYINHKEITIVFEKAFGRLSFKDELVKFKKEIEHKNNHPSSYIEGSPIEEVPISSITVFGVSKLGDSTKVLYISDKNKKKNIGTIINTLNGRYLYLFGLEGKEDKDTLLEYNNFYEDLDEYFKESNFNAKDIVRTWIYLDEIDLNYSNLNLARREYFNRKKIDYSSDSNSLPASTCIGGKCSNDATLGMDVFCIDKSSNSFTIARMYNKLQNEAEGQAYQFKPTFSRGTLIDYETHIEAQVSGTASINETGETVFIDDPYKQIKKTLINVGVLLKEKNMTYSDFCLSTCFFKKKEYYEYFKKALAELNIPNDFSHTFVIGDVCRANLLFELDGVAIKMK